MIRVPAGPATSVRLVLVDLASMLFGIPFRQAGLIWSFAPVLVPLRLPVVPLAGQLIHGDLNHLRPVAGRGRTKQRPRRSSMLSNW